MSTGKNEAKRQARLSIKTLLEHSASESEWVREIARDCKVDVEYVRAYVIEVGFKIGGKKKLSNDLTVRADFNLRDNTTILRKVIEGTNQPSAGTKTLSVKVSADYPVNERFNVRAFYDYSANNPFVSTSYPTSYTNAGIAIRFTLAQ